MTPARCVLFLAAGFVAVLGFGAFSPDTMNITDNNATLRNIPSTAVPYVTRMGYAAPGDAPPLVFKASNAACSLNSGNGDGGSQVKSLDNKCWIAEWPDRGKIDIRQFGAVPDNSTDAAPAIQAAYNARVGRIYAPGSVGVWKIASTVTAADWPFKLIGDHPNEPQDTHVCPTGTPSGTWVHLTNSTASKFRVQQGSTANATQGTSFEDFGVCQDHPAPGGGWTPTAYPPVIDLSATQACFINRIFWYGVYDAINLTASARCTVNEQRGQVFRRFWIGDNLQDMSQLNDWHLWPFWSNDPNVVTWQQNNGDVITLGRVDGAHMTNIFALGYRNGILYQNSPGGFGTAKGIMGINIYFDSTVYGIHTSPGMPNPVEGSFSNLNYGGENASANSEMMKIEAGSSIINVSGYYCLAAAVHCIDVTGQNSFVTISGDYNLIYDSNGAGAAALYANSTNPSLPAYIYSGTPPAGLCSAPCNNAPLADNTTANGYVVVGGWITRNYTPELTFNGTNAGMTYAAGRSASIRKNLFTGEVNGNAKLTLTAIGSSTGSAGVSLPAGFAGAAAVGKFERDQMGSTIWVNAWVGTPAAPFVFAPAAATGLQLLANNGGAFLTQANFSGSTSMQISW